MLLSQMSFYILYCLIIEFTDFIGVPLNQGLVFVHNCLVGTNLREHIRIICSGKIISGFDMVCKLALGADMCNSARGMMFALGCIQSRRCNKNTCPTGVTTQKPDRVYALNVDDKAPKVANYHHATVESCLEVLGAAGLKHIRDITPDYIYRRTGTSEFMPHSELFTFLKAGQLLTGEDVPPDYAKAWALASADYFHA